MMDSTPGLSERRRGRILLGAVALGASILAAGWIALGSGASPTRFGTVGEIHNRVASGPDRDIPCVESPEGTIRCATPLPALTSQDRATSRALVVEGLRVPLDRIGSYRVNVGEAALARGIIEVMSLSLGNANDGSYSAPLFSLALQDAATGATLPRSVYEKGIVDGPHRVNVLLTFDLQEFKTGAVVQVARIEVR